MRSFSWLSWVSFLDTRFVSYTVECFRGADVTGGGKGRTVSGRRDFRPQDERMWSLRCSETVPGYRIVENRTCKYTVHNLQSAGF